MGLTTNIAIKAIIIEMVENGTSSTASSAGGVELIVSEVDVAEVPLEVESDVESEVVVGVRKNEVVSIAHSPSAL